MNRTGEKAILMNRILAVMGLGRHMCFLTALQRFSPAPPHLYKGFCYCGCYEGIGKNVLLNISTSSGKYTEVICMQKRRLATPCPCFKILPLAVV